MRCNPPIKVKLYYPEHLVLVQRVSEIHAEFVKAYIKKLSCPTQQKLKLIDAITQTTGMRD